MTKLNCNSTFGNFKWFATADVSETDVILLAQAGLLQILQRSPASKAEKSMGGYEKRPDDFKRSDIAWSKENEETLAKFLSEEVKAKIADGVYVTLKPSVRCEYHEIGATAEPKYADEKKAINRHIEAGDILKWNETKVKFFGEGDLDAENIEFLKAVRSFKLEMLKSNL